jgi:GH25 family lysozyme M1 (1,4-beta-N-acetylmuramidase)
VIHPAIHGIDVSDVQDTADWDDFAFGFARATEGDKDADERFARHVIGMSAAGLLLGAYHVARPAGDPELQARHFLGRVTAELRADAEAEAAAEAYDAWPPAELPAVQLPPVLLAVDLRTADGRTPEEVAAFARELCAAVRRLSGALPFVRTFRHFAEEGHCSGLEDYPLWIAAPGRPAADPVVPPPWSTWTLHQYANSPVNQNVFAGSRQELTAFAARG